VAEVLAYRIGAFDEYLFPKLLGNGFQWRLVGLKWRCKKDDLGVSHRIFWGGNPQAATLKLAFRAKAFLTFSEFASCAANVT
jgi:hypothetical protein